MTWSKVVRHWRCDVKRNKFLYNSGLHASHMAYTHTVSISVSVCQCIAWQYDTWSKVVRHRRFDVRRNTWGASSQSTVLDDNLMLQRLLSSSLMIKMFSVTLWSKVVRHRRFDVRRNTWGASSQSTVLDDNLMLQRLLSSSLMRKMFSVTLLYGTVLCNNWGRAFNTRIWTQIPSLNKLV